MRSMDLFCASTASTAICSSMDQPSMVRHGTRLLDRHSHRLGNQTRTHVPCSSHLPFDPKSYYQKYQKSSARPSELHRKSSNRTSTTTYLLSDAPRLIDFLADSSENSQALVPSQPLIRTKQQTNTSTSLLRSSSTRLVESPIFQPSPAHSYDSNVHRTSLTRSCSREQVVELMVSIYCKCCEGKLRKHISRMEGVKSFSIDLASRKVTVIGDVTPLGVLASISKVKNAQFWPSPATL